MKTFNIGVKHEENDKPFVSVIIPTFNSGKTLEVCLSSIRNQTHLGIEIIVVDNYSDDDTEEIAKKYSCIFVQKKALRSEARNYGAKMAHGEFYFFVDSDMELFPTLVQECVREMMKNQGVKAIIGPEWAAGKGFWARCKALERELNIGYEVVEAPRFFSRDAFWKVGGYDPELEAGEDWDLFQRVRKAGRVSRVKSGWIHHEGEPTILDLMKRKYHYGKSIHKYIEKRKRGAQKTTLLKQCFFLRSDYFKKWNLFTKNLRVIVGFILMKALEFAAASVGLICDYLLPARYAWAVPKKRRYSNKQVQTNREFAIFFDRMALEEEQVTGKDLLWIDESRFYTGRWDKWRLDFMDKLSGNLKPFRILLDFGCGNGKRLLYVLRNHQENYGIGVDISKESVKIASRKAKLLAMADRVDFILCDGQSLPFREAVFSDVLVFDVLHHLRSLSPIREIYSVMLSGGTLWIKDQLMSNPLLFIGRKLIHHLRFAPEKGERFLFLSPGMFKRCLETVGFQIESEEFREHFLGYVGFFDASKFSIFKSVHAKTILSILEKKLSGVYFLSFLARSVVITSTRSGRL